MSKIRLISNDYDVLLIFHYVEGNNMLAGSRGRFPYHETNWATLFDVTAGKGNTNTYRVIFKSQFFSVTTGI